MKIKFCCFHYLLSIIFQCSVLSYISPNKMKIKNPRGFVKKIEIVWKDEGTYLPNLSLFSFSVLLHLCNLSHAHENGLWRHNIISVKIKTHSNLYYLKDRELVLNCSSFIDILGFVIVNMWIMWYVRIIVDYII